MNANHSAKVLQVASVWLVLTIFLCALGLTAGSQGFEWGLEMSDPVVMDIRLPRTLGGYQPSWFFLAGLKCFWGATAPRENNTTTWRVR
jgi:hypothetical protein